MSDNPFLSKLGELRDNLGKLLDLHNNPFDTSNFSGNGVIQQVQNLQQQLGNALGMGGDDRQETTSSPNTSSVNLPRSISASVGKGGTNKEADVRAVQGWLNHHGANLEVDGQYGNGTLREINRFQRRAGLTADGIISPDKNTWKSLIGERPVGERSSAVASIIQGGESGPDGYNAYNLGTNGNSIIGGGQKLELVSMTLGEIMAKQRRGELFAVGKYQIVPDTLQGGVDNLGLPESRKFDPPTQDLLFSGWLMKNKRPEIHAYITGSGDQRAAQVAGAMEWASIASPPGTKGYLGHDVSHKSYYDGHGGNVAHITVDDFLYALNEAKADYRRLLESGKSPEEAYHSAVTGVENTANTGGSNSDTPNNNTSTGSTNSDTGSTSNNLGASVGKGGANNAADVRLVQTLLNQKASAGLSVDGQSGPNTIAAIENFQKSVFNGWSDGLVEPGGNTIKALTGGDTSTNTGNSNTGSTSTGGSISASVGQGGTNNSSDVRIVQELLNGKGASLTVDGQSGPNTVAAIENFQKSVFNGWSDGLVEPGGNTIKALTGNGGSVSTGNGNTGNNNNGNGNGVVGNIVDAIVGAAGGLFGGRELSGSVGEGGTNNKDDVGRVQELLNKKGGNLSVDGQIGPNTINAIRGFQSANGLPTDGLIEPGKNTWKKLTGNGKNISSNTGSTTGGSSPAPVRPTGSYSYHDHPNWQNVRLEYQPGSRTARQLNPTAERLLRSVTAEAGLDYVLVTSTKRTYADQAYITLTQVTESEAFQWYGYAVSDQARFYRHKRELANGKDPEAVYAEYGDYIRRVAGEGASNHIPGYAIDVSMSGLGAFNAGAGRLVPISGSGVRTIFPETGRSHIEFTFIVV